MRWLALVLAFAPALAHALSCSPWGVTDAFIEADAAAEDYVIVQGSLRFDETLWPEVDMDRQDETPPLTVIPGRIEGHAFSRRGPDIPFATDVLVRVSCAGPWCPGPLTGDVLAFLEKRPYGYAAHFAPCGDGVFPAPNADQIRAVTRCIRGRSCPPTTFD